jgi:CRP-like cAMP-binding protein
MVESETRSVDAESIRTRGTDASGTRGGPPITGDPEFDDVGEEYLAEAIVRLIRQGESADRLFVVIAGTMQVSVDGRHIGTIGAGETVGEMALLDHGPRSADVVATGKCTVVEFMMNELSRLMTIHPRLGQRMMLNLAAHLAERLRRADGLCANADLKPDRASASLCRR